MSIQLNQVRLVCNDGDRKGLHVKSTLDNTYTLDTYTDESISFTDRDLVAIKNRLERPCELLLEVIQSPTGHQYVVLKPSRQAHVKLFDPAVSKIRSEISLVLGPGETCMVHSSAWSSEGGEGRRVPV